MALLCADKRYVRAAPRRCSQIAGGPTRRGPHLEPLLRPRTRVVFIRTHSSTPADADDAYPREKRSCLARWQDDSFVAATAAPLGCRSLHEAATIFTSTTPSGDCRKRTRQPRGSSVPDARPSTKARVRSVAVNDVLLARSAHPALAGGAGPAANGRPLERVADGSKHPRKGRPIAFHA